MKHLIHLLLAAWIGFSVFMCYGCVQRIVEYNPDTGYWRYQSNSFASDTMADRIKIVTPAGIVIEIDKAYVNNDSFTFRFNPATRQIEVVTESGE